MTSELKSPSTSLKATVMFTDIVGYTSMMEANETEALRNSQQNHEIQKSLIEKYHGHYVKELGDGVLAYFKDTLEALQCSREIQIKTHASSDIKVRIGLHYSEIICENDDIYGDGVNLASRIQSLAEPGGIYLSEETHLAINGSDKIETKLMGPARLKNVKERVTIYAVVDEQLPEPSKKRFMAVANPRKKLAVIPTTIVFVVLVSISIFLINFLQERARIIAAEASLDEVEELVDFNWRNFAEPYYILKEAQQYIPDNPRLKKLIDQTAVNINVTSEPSGAIVSIKLYDQPESEWKELGVTPLESIELPISAVRWKIQKEGYEEVLAAAFTMDIIQPERMEKNNMYIGKHFHRVLDKKGSIPPKMTRVAGHAMPTGRIGDFFIDVYEVNNSEYGQFIKNAGYENPEYWVQLITDLEGAGDWKEMVDSFVDRTGKPGPSVWLNQEFPQGQENLPVSGINWYEANAYAQFVGKSLPSKDHWGLAAGEASSLISVPQLGGNSIFAPFSNFHRNGPIQSGSLDGISPYGVYDMGGNVREWCWNKSDRGRWIRGGAWSDNPYMFTAPSQANPIDRSERNGFRCAIYLDPDSIPAAVLTEIVSGSIYDIINPPVEDITPVSDETFKIYKDFYGYDQEGLFSEVLSLEENPDGWTLETVNLKAPYNDEEFYVYLFIPTHVDPPYQSVIYGPGANVLTQVDSKGIEDFFEFRAFLEFIVKSGRVVMFPVIKGSFERREDDMSFYKFGSHQHVNYMIQVIKDYRRCLDYLESRNDFDDNKIAFYGMSMGPRFGVLLSALDNRVKTNIFYASGLGSIERPEAFAANFLPRIRIPTLMLNGRFDSIFKLEGILKQFELLGTPEDQKKLILFDSDHLASKGDLVRETLYWLDQQFGQVIYVGDATRI